MGIIPNAALQTSHAPFAEAARLVMGTMGHGHRGRLRDSQVRSAHSAAGCCWSDNPQRQRRPTACSRPCSARVNRHGVPGVGLTIVGVLMTIVLFATMSPTIAGQFSTDRRPRGDPGRLFRERLFVGGAGEGRVRSPSAASHVPDIQVDRHCRGRSIRVWTVLGGDPPTVVNAMVALLASVPLDRFFIRFMEADPPRHGLTTRRQSGPILP